MQISTLQTAYMIERIQHLILSIEKNLFSHVGVINVVVTSPCKIPNMNCKIQISDTIPIANIILWKFSETLKNNGKLKKYFFET